MKILLPALCACLFASPLPAEEKGDAPKTIKLRDLSLAVPANWTKEKPLSSMRLGQFKFKPAGKDKDKSELTIFNFGGGGGGIQANISRWQNQFVAKDRKSTVKMGSSKQGKYVVVEISGTFMKPDNPNAPPFRQKKTPTAGYKMIGFILAIEKKGMYFLKAVGPKATIDANAEALRASIGAKSANEKPIEKKSEKKD